MKFLSHFLSWVFLPLLMPSYGILISLFVPAYSADIEMTSLYFAPIESKWALFTIFFLFSVVAPGVSFVLLHRFKVISTIDIERQGERSLFFGSIFPPCIQSWSRNLAKIFLCSSIVWRSCYEYFFVDQPLD